MPKTISATEASNKFGTMIDEVASGQSLFVVTRMGQPRAVVLGVTQYLEMVDELEIREEQNDPDFQAALVEAHKQAELGQAISLEEFDEQFGFKTQDTTVESSDA